MILPGCRCCGSKPCYNGRRSLLITIQGFGPEHVGYGLRPYPHWLAVAAGWGRNPRTLNGTHRLWLDDGVVCRWIACLPTPNRREAISASASDGQGFNIIFDAGGLPAVTINPDNPAFYGEAETVSGDSLPQRITLAGGAVVVTVENDDGRPLPSDTAGVAGGFVACGCPEPSPGYSWISLDPSCLGGDGVVCYDDWRPSIPDVELDLKVQGISAKIDAAASRRYSLRRGTTSGTLLLGETYDGTGDDGVGWSTQVVFDSNTGSVATVAGDLFVYLSITPTAGKPWESVYEPDYFGTGGPSWRRDKSNPTVCDGTKNRYAIQVEIEGRGGLGNRLGFFTMAEFFTDQCFDRLCNGVRPFRVERDHVHHWPPSEELAGMGVLVLPGPTIKLPVERP